MKGIILSGGSGTRLRPLTKITSKQLLPVYNKPMIYYPLNTLIQAGIKDILVIISPERAGDYLNLLGSGSQFGVKISYEVQEKPEGLAQAFLIAENFIGSDNVALILGDNIFEDDFSADIINFKSGAKIFAREVSDPERFGVVKFNNQQLAEKIVEKPVEYLSNYAVTGLYLCDYRAVSIAKNLQPSSRGELEIVDVLNYYLEKQELTVSMVNGQWFDAGTFDSLLEVQNFAKEKLASKMII